jgi:hypothetical protein
MYQKSQSREGETQLLSRTETLQITKNVSTAMGFRHKSDHKSVNIFKYLKIKGRKIFCPVLVFMDFGRI